MAAYFITLTTDFGTEDPYVGVMKGVILGIKPQASIVDLTHQVRPQDIPGAAFLLGTAYAFFPRGTIHVVVVDPGVGSSRRPLLLDTGTAWFVAPDDGVLSYVLRDGGIRTSEAVPFASCSVALPAGWQAHSLTNAAYWRHPVSHTFHGRDIFAPVAAHLSLGVAAEELGEPTDRVTCLSIAEASEEGGVLTGQVIHVDRFGNLVTNIPGSRVEGQGTRGEEQGSRVEVEVAGHRIRGLASSYAEAPEEALEGTMTRVLAIVGSHGYLEVSVRNGNAADTLGIDLGATVRVRWL